MLKIRLNIQAIKNATRILVIGFFGCCLIWACSNHTQEPETFEQVASKKKNLEKVNRYLVSKDAEAIESYAKRHNWDMQTTKTGLWYMIYQNGKGAKAEKGKIATISYIVSLLDGTICYTVDSISPKRFKIGQGGVEHGLEEGILLLRQGDKARFIMPPYQAHGLLGDENKIPPRATIIFDLQLLKISDD